MAAVFPVSASGSSASSTSSWDGDADDARAAAASPPSPQDLMRLAVEAPQPCWYAVASLAQAHGRTVTRLLVAGAGEMLPETPLHAAARARRPEILGLLLARGAEVDAGDWSGRTALHVAVDIGCLECVRVLVAGCAEVGAGDEQGITAVHHAAGCGDLEVLRVLVRGGEGWELWAEDTFQQRPVHYGIAAGRRDAVEWIWEIEARWGIEEGTRLVNFARQYRRPQMTGLVARLAFDGGVSG